MWTKWGSKARLATVVAVLLVVSLASWGLLASSSDPAVVIGKIDATEAPTAAPEPGPPEVPVPELAPDPLLSASGSGPGPRVAFRGAVNVPDDLAFFLVIGSDARPGQDVVRSRADSIHIVAVDPKARVGTVLGLPRDSYVDVPGHGRRKINSALALGGPDLLVRTVRELTGFPVEFYAVTAFDGIVRIVDELGGVDIEVPYRMDDRYSGARFEPGWHHMDGRQVLAFSRARHGVPGGDLGRSENHGRVMLHALEKMGAETSDAGDIRRWVAVLYKHARLDMSMAEAVELGVLARQVLPADLANVVAPGTSRSAGGQSVVVLDDAAYELFRDVGADAMADGKTERQAPATTPSPTAPPRPPAPTPSPSPTPAPAPLPLPEL